VGHIGKPTANPRTDACSVFEKIAEIPPLFLGGATDLALPLAGIETCGLVLQPLDLFGRGDIIVIVDGQCMLETVIQKARDLDTPTLYFGLYFKFVSNNDGPGCLDGISVLFDFSLVTGIRGLRPGLEKPDRPEIFIKTQFFFFGHDYILRFGKELMKIGDRFDAFIEIFQPELFIGRVQVITVQPKSHEDDL
jgi:hypothetical protein